MILPSCLAHGAKSVASAVVAASPAILTTTTSTAAAGGLSGLIASPINNLLMPHSTALVGLVRGGGAAAMDISRFKLRLDGLHTYAVITTLLMNASLRLFSATPKRFVAEQKVRNVLKIVFSALVTISVLTGSYTTIVLSLVELYAKRALGRGQDVAVLQFFTSTQPIRELAYDTWIVSLVAFQASFVLSLFLNHDGGWDVKLAVGAAVAAVLCWWKWSTVMVLASTLLQFGTDM